MKVNRTQAPEIKRTGQLDIVWPSLMHLDNGIPVHLISSDISDACRIEFIFRAGSIYQTSPLTARFTNLLMTEGSTKHNASETAHQLEFYGAYLSPSATRDFASFNLSVLNSKLENVLPLVSELFQSPAFNEADLEMNRENERKSFTDDLRKVQSVAARQFNQLVFGARHPYGINAELSDFDNIHPDLLRDFHRNHYLPETCMILASGSIKEKELSLLNTYIGNKEWSQQGRFHFVGQEGLSAPPPSKAFFEMPDKLQNAIRVGKQIIKAGHADYPGLQVLNTILGGYFGSRLMSNIREDKGYTYGIYSMIVSYLHAGLFIISTETAAETSEATLKEIYIELQKLRENKVSTVELERVRNYLLGSLQRSFDNPFNTLDAIRNKLEAGLDPQIELKKQIECIQTITPDEIIDLSQKYLQADSLSEFICGKNILISTD